MKKLLFPLLLLIILFLVSCAEEKEYELTKNNVESFYEVNLDYEIQDNGFRYNLSFDNKYKMSTENFAITLELHFKVHKTTGGYTYQSTSVYNLREFEYSGFLSNQNISEVELYYIYVENTRGNVYSKSRIKVVDKTYEHLTKPPFTGSLVKEDEIENNRLITNKLQDK